MRSACAAKPMVVNMVSKSTGKEEADTSEQKGEQNAIRVSTTNSWIGPAYKKYHRSNGRNPYDARHLPTVEAMVKVYSVRNINMVEGTFDADFNLMIDWEDKSLEGRTEAMGGVVDWDQHFVPSIFVENALNLELVGGESKPRLRPEPNHVTHTQRMRATLRVKYNVKNFPLDSQYLVIKFKSRTVSDGMKWINGASATSATVRFGDPYTWRGKSGHVVAKNADELPDQEIVKIDGGAVCTNTKNPGVPNEYHVQICIIRESQGIIFGLGVPIFGVMILSFAVFVMDIDGLGDRMALVITNMLTLVAIKWVLEAKLPSVPYLTLADEYILACFLLLVIQGILCAIATAINSSEEEDAAYQLNRWSMIVLGIIFVLTHVYMAFKAYGLTDVEQLKATQGLVEVKEEALENNAMDSPFQKGPKFDPLEDDGHLNTTPGLPYGWIGPIEVKLTNKKGKTQHVKYYRNMESGWTQYRPPTAIQGELAKGSSLRNRKRRMATEIEMNGRGSFEELGS